MICSQNDAVPQLLRVAYRVYVFNMYSTRYDQAIMRTEEKSICVLSYKLNVTLRVRIIQCDATGKLIFIQRRIQTREDFH